MGRSSATRRHRRAGDRRGRPRVVVVVADPYLAVALEEELPDSELVTIRTDLELQAAPLADADLIIVDLSHPRVAQVLLHRGAVPILGIARGDVGKVSAQCDAVLVRPLGPTELARAVHRLLGHADAEPRQPREWVSSVRTWLPIARVAAVALVAVLEIVATSVAPQRAAILAFAFVYAALRTRVPRQGRLGIFGDIAVAAVLVLLTGGPVSNYALFGLVVAASAGLVLGIVPGVLAAAVISLAGLVELAGSLAPDSFVEPVYIGSFVILFPLAAAAGGMAGQIWDARARRSSLSLLLEANRALGSLYRIGRERPGGLTMQRVAAAIVEETRSEVGAAAAVLLLEDADSLYEAAADGLSEHPRIVLDAEELAAPGRRLGAVHVLDRGEVPEVLAGVAPPGSRWSAVTLGSGGARLGALLVATQGGMDVGERRTLRRIAREGAVALHNARLFERLRELAVDEERVRLADELHDTVAQGLAHVRMELDFLARHGSELGDLRAEAARVGGVVGRTLADVRATIGELRAAVGPAGLAGALRDHARDLRGAGNPDIRVQIGTGVRSHPEVEVELFRIARDAITNGLRHAGVSLVTLTLEQHADTLVLSVHDNGRPLDPVWDRRAGSEAARLKQMEERAEQLGGSFEVTRPEAGGTCVTVRYPLLRSTEDVTAVGTRLT